MSVNCLPDIGNKPDWFEIALFIVIPQIIRPNLCVQHKYRLGKNVLPEAFDVFREGYLEDSKDYEADVAENKLVGFFFLLLGLAD